VFLKEIYFLVINFTKDSALHLASEYNHANVVNFLLDCGAEFKYNSEKLSFIDIAIKKKHREVLLAIIYHDK
jgi:ankyrin repeat protein